MSTQAIASSLTTPSAAAKQSSASSGGLAGGLNSNDFMKLLTTQLQNQDPLNPETNSDFAAQMAQFSTLQGITQLNTNLTQMLLLQNLTQGASLVGKNVTYQPSGNGNTSQGLVNAVSMDNGQLQLHIGDHTVGLNQVLGIGLPSAGSSSNLGS
jgi:flagellar basal-body rod modification protein FlgD